MGTNRSTLGLFPAASCLKPLVLPPEPPCSAAFPTDWTSRTPYLGQEEHPRFRIPAHPVTAITLGAGARGNVYGDYAVEYPGELDIVGVAEPKVLRHERCSHKHNITEKKKQSRATLFWNTCEPPIMAVAYTKWIITKRTTPFPPGSSKTA